LVKSCTKDRKINWWLACTAPINLDHLLNENAPKGR
jgi:hypothetical protein